MIANLCWKLRLLMLRKKLLLCHTDYLITKSEEKLQSGPAVTKAQMERTRNKVRFALIDTDECPAEGDSASE